MTGGFTGSGRASDDPAVTDVAARTSRSSTPPSSATTTWAPSIPVACARRPRHWPKAGLLFSLLVTILAHRGYPASRIWNWRGRSTPR